MTIKAINNIAEYNNLVLTLLVFDIFSRITSNNISTLSTIERVKTINIAIIEVIKLHATRQINNAL